MGNFATRFATGERLYDGADQQWQREGDDWKRRGRHDFSGRLTRVDVSVVVCSITGSGRGKDGGAGKRRWNGAERKVAARGQNVPERGAFDLGAGERQRRIAQYAARLRQQETRF